MKPSVLFLCMYPAVYGGNFIPSLMALETKLDQKGFDSVYCFPKEAENRYWFGKLHQMGKKLVAMDFSCGFRKFSRSVREICEKYNVKIVYTHFADDLQIGLFSWLNPGIKVVVHIHSDFTGGAKPSALQRCKRFLGYHVLLGKVRAISVSQDLVSMNPKTITHVPNALATERIPCPHTGRKELRASLGVGPEETLIEIYGWEPTIKGVDIAVMAMKKLVHTLGVHAKLAIVCGHINTPDKMRQWIHANTGCSGEENFLVYLPAQEDVFAYHEAADLILSASRSEGFSYSLLEMLSLGKSCVISDIPGTSWAGEFGIVFSFASENPEDCAEKLKTAILRCSQPNPQVAQAILQRFSMEEWTDTVTGLLMEK